MSAARERYRLASKGAIMGAALSLLIFSMALWFLHRELAGLTRDAVAADILSIPVTRLLAAI